MQGNKQNQKQNYQANNKRTQKQCELGWNCERILHNKCNFKHDPNDKEDIQSLNRIRKQETIIIIETYNKQIRPICLFQVFLPIKVMPNQKVKIQVGKYYVGYFVTVEGKCALIEVKICLGNFGDWKIQRKIFQDHMPPIFEKCKTYENTKERRGKINVNGALQKVLSGEEGLREYFHRVNQKGKYALFEGCEVSYFEKNRQIQITRIKYPEYQKFSGILQIDGSSQFYFVARSETFDEMNPYRIPEYLCEQLKEFIHSIPYTLLKKKELKKQIRDNINVMLKDYLVRGEFKEWPLESRYPIIAIENEVQTRTFQSEKQGIIYQTGIAIRSFSRNEKKQSDKLMNKFKIKDYEKKRKLFNGKIFTVDSKTTKCHDDALEILQTEDGDYRVRIHIADIAEVIKPSSSLDRSMQERDSTLYIRDYFQPMIHESLRNKLSLKQGDPKLAFTLSFKVSKDGQIDFSSVRFINSIIEVEKNLAHERLESKAEKYPQLFQLSQCLGKGDLLRQSSLIDYGLKSEFCMSRMIQLSGIIPTVMMQLNVQRSKIFKQKFDQYLKKIIEQKQKEMEEWQNQVDKINKVRKQLNLTSNKEKKLKKQILKEIEKQRERLIRKIKEEEKTKSQQEKKQKPKKQKKPKGISKLDDSNLLSQDSDSQIQTEVLNEQETLSIGATEQNHVEDLIEDLNEVLIKEKEKRVKALKQMKNKENFVEISSSESQYSDDESEEDVTLNEGYKMTKAMGGKKFLQKIFSHFKDVKLQWLKESQINDAFRQILRLDKGKLYQQYFKRLQITNRQHFPYIVQKARKQKRQNDRKNGKQQTQKQDRRDRMRGRNRKQENKIQDEGKREQLQRENGQKQNQKEMQNKSSNANRVQKKKYSNRQTQNQSQKMGPNIPKLEPKKEQIESSKKQSFTNNQNEDEKRQLDAIKSGLKGIQKNLQRLEENAKFPIMPLAMPPSMKPIGVVPGISSHPISSFMRSLPDSLTNLLKPPFMSLLGMVPQMGSKPPSQIKRDFKIPPNYMPPSTKVPHSKLEPFQSKEFDFQLQKSKIPRQSKKHYQFSKDQNEKIERMINYLVSHQEQIQKKYSSFLRNGEELKPQFSEEEKKMFQESQQNFRDQYSYLKKLTIIRLLKLVEKRNKKNIRQKKIQKVEQKKQKKSQTNVQQQDSMEGQQKDISRSEIDDDQSLKVNKMPSPKKMNSKKRFDLQLEKNKIPRQSKKKSEFTKEQNQCLQQMVNNLIQQDEQNQEKYFSKMRNGMQLQQQINEEEKKMLEKSQQNFSKQYVRLKRNTIIKLYQLAKEKSKNDRSQQQKKEIKQNLQPNSKKHVIQKISKEKFLTKQSINLQKDEKQLQKDSTNVQISVEVNASTKVQTVAQEKASKDVCQNLVYKNSQTKVQQKIQANFQQNDDVLPSKNDDEQRDKQILNEKKQVCENAQKDQQKQAQNQIPTSKPQVKKSKKQINKIVQQLMKAIAEEIKSKYTEQLEKLTEEINKLKKQETDSGKLLKLELQKSNVHFNLIKLIVHQQNCKDDESENQSQKDEDDDQSVNGKKTKKNKKKNKKNKKKSKKSVSMFEQILDNFYSYADKSNHDFSIMDDQELDEFLKKQLGFKEIYESENYSLENINQQAARIAAENMALKWNNPIRSYESLMVMRLIKQHDWLFQGNIFPTEIVQFGDDIKKLDKKLKKLKQYREDKIANGQNDKKVKEANRQIDYLQFYYKLKKNPDRVYTFLNITSPTPKVKRVFHEILGDVDLQNTKFVQELYKEVKGKVKIVEDFPIKLKIEIIQ